MRRSDGRKKDQLREVVIIPNFVDHPEGSILISFGQTRVLCNLTIEASVPAWFKNSKRSGGWITAEYALLPRSTHRRTSREIRGLRGRTQEIQRMIGRSLRAAVDLQQLGARTCIVDCDVLQADGGTRTAAITGGYLALAIGLRKLISEGELSASLLLPPVAAISTGIVSGEAYLDLSYDEDVHAEVDLNIVMNAERKFIELQGTAERTPFAAEALDDMLALARKGVNALLEIQTHFLETNAPLS